MPWLTGQDIPEGRVADIEKGRESVSADAIRNSATRIVPEGTVLMTTRVTVGKTAVAVCPLCYSQDVTGISLRSDGLVIPHFLAYFLLSQRSKFLSRNQGSTIAGITRDNLALEQIPLPPLSEQRRIVEILRESEQIQRLRFDAQKISSGIVFALFREMFIEATDRVNWAETTVEHIAASKKDSIRTGPFGSDLLHSEFVNEGVAVLGIDNVVQNRFLWGERRFISGGKYSNLRRYRVYPNDVMVSIMGTVGRVAVAPEDLPEAISTKHLCVITVDTEVILPLFLWATLLYDTDVRAQAKLAGKGAVMEGWNSKIIRSLRFRKPPIDLQRAFTEAVSRFALVEDLFPVVVDIEANLFRSLSAYAFSGKLTAQWRVRHESEIIKEVLTRDEALGAAGATVISRATEASPNFTEKHREDSRTNNLTRDQTYLLRELRCALDGAVIKRQVMFMSADEIAGALTGLLHGNVQAVESNLAVLVARGLVIALSLEQRTPDTDETVYGNCYRLPVADPAADEDEGAQSSGGVDGIRDQEILRLLGNRKREESAP